jgi:SOS-response transcriptional repressor LexA
MTLSPYFSTGPLAPFGRLGDCMPNYADHSSLDPSEEWLVKGRNLGTWFRDALRRAGTNINQLAAKTGISTSYLYDIRDDCLHGRVAPRQFKKVEASKIRQIAEALGADVNAGLRAFGYDPDGSVSTVPPELAHLDDDGRFHLARLMESLMRSGGVQPLGAQTVQVPIIGSVSAGTPALAAENIKEHIAIPTHLLEKYNPDECFAVRVKGNCLEGLHIIDGDLLICRSAAAAADRDIVVITSDENEAVTKRYREQGASRWVETVPSPPSRSERVTLNGVPRILGVKVGMYRAG